MMFSSNYGYPCGVNLFVIQGQPLKGSADYLTLFDPVFTWLPLPYCAWAWEDKTEAQQVYQHLTQICHPYSSLHLGQIEFYDTTHGVHALPVTLLKQQHFGLNP